MNIVLVVLSDINYFILIFKSSARGGRWASRSGGDGRESRGVRSRGEGGCPRPPCSRDARRRHLQNPEEDLGAAPSAAPENPIDVRAPGGAGRRAGSASGGDRPAATAPHWGAGPLHVRASPPIGVPASAPAEVPEGLGAGAASAEGAVTRRGPRLVAPAPISGSLLCPGP